MGERRGFAAQETESEYQSKSIKWLFSNCLEMLPYDSHILWLIWLTLKGLKDLR